MKRNLLLLAVMVTVVFGFSSVAVAQDPGTPDTLYLEVYPADDSLFGDGPWLVKMPLYIWHDLPSSADSLGGIVIPLCYTSSNSAAYCSVTSYNNDMCLTGACPPVPWVLSAFRDIPPDANWFWYQDGIPWPDDKLAWDTREITLESDSSWVFWAAHTDSAFLPPHWWLLIAGSAKPDQGFWDGSRILIATVTFNVQDSTTICIDTCFWPPSSRLQFGVTSPVTYTFIPQFEGLCVEVLRVPNILPVAGCPDNVSYNTSGTKTVTGVTGTDADGIITGATVQIVNGCGQVSNVSLVNEQNLNTASYTADVQFDVDHCAQCTDVIKVTVTDDAQGTDDCTFEVTCTNTNPTVNAGGDKTGAYNVQLCSDAIVTGDVDGDAVTWDFTVDSTPDGTMQKDGDKVCFDATCDDVSITYTVTVTATDACDATATDDFTMKVTNAAPVVTCFGPFSAKTGETVTFNGAYSFTDEVPGAATESGSALLGTVNSVSGGDVNYTAPATAGAEVITVTITDECGEEGSCTFDVTIVTVENQVKIPNRVYERFGFAHWVYPETPEQEPAFGEVGIYVDDFCYPYEGVHPGSFFEIPIILNAFKPEFRIGGFELEVEFDYIDLTFYGAERGILLSFRDDIEDTSYSWEYFSYRVLPCTDLHKYKILLFGQADMPDGIYRKGYCLNPTNDFPETYWATDMAWYNKSPDGWVLEEVGPTLVWLKFRVANNELLRDLKLPVFFEWEHKLHPDHYYIVQDWDCAENTMSSCDGNMLYVSKNTMQYEPAVCGYDVETILDFVDGGVHVCSPCTAFVCVRGDINHDAIAYTTADAVLFARYFVEGLGVFIVDRDEQICATDVNADGRTLMLADLIYLIRVILQVAPEIPKPGPSSDVVNVIVYNNTITTECASPIGAILFEFDGAVQPTLLANMEMVNKGNKVLVWSRDGNTITTAEVLSFTGDAELVSVTAVDYDTRELQTSITAKVAPTAFALNPAYPNPFNPFTNLSFTLPEAVSYSLNIYNVAGQLVRSYEGMGVTGLNVITWDGKDYAGVEVASGVYFYKLTAAGFTATQKMVMMK